MSNPDLNQLYSIQGYNLVTLLKRLEAATSRLEDVTVFQEEISSRGKSSTPSTESTATTVAQAPTPAAAAATPLPSAPSPEESIPKAISEFDNFIESTVEKFAKLSSEIDPIVGEQVGYLLQAFKEERKFLLAASKSKKVQVSDPEFAEALKPINLQIEKIISVKDSNRQSKFFNHLNTLSEGCPVLGWVVVNTPISYIPDYKDAAQFWTNRIMKEFKESDPKQVEWSRLFLLIFDDLRNYVKEHQTTGPTWNNQGIAFSDALKEVNKSSSGSAAAPAAPKPALGGPPPPPPPPPADLYDTNTKAASESAGGMNAVFESLSKGENITKGLKKVDKSQMTHKNPELRASSTVSAAPASKKPVPPKKPTSLSQKPAKKPAKKELLDTKWLVENFEDNHEIVIEGEMYQSVFIGKCNNCTIQVKGKINALSLSECTNVGLVVDQLVSGIDIIKSTKFGVQVLNTTPIITVDQSDGGQIYLAKTSLNTEVLTSSTTALNINVPDDEQDGDFKEVPVPEQFKHSFNEKGVMVSTIVEHAG